MSVQLLRNSRVWASTVTSGFTTSNTVEILVQDDFSFGQDSNSTDITVNEAGPAPTRGARRFNDSLNAAEWSFSTYLLPYVDASDNLVKVPDLMLWQGVSSGSPLNLSSVNGVSANTTNMLVNFKDNAYHELLMLNFYVLTDNVWYQIKSAQVNQAEINVDIEDIGLVTWSGNGTQLIPLEAAPFNPTTLGMTDAQYQLLQSSYIKNKLTILRIRNVETDTSYNIPITGGSVTLNNNITYLTPNTLSRVDVPIGSFTGAFEMTGSLSAYLNDRSLGSVALYNSLMTTLKTTNKFEIALILGGEYDSARPAVVIVMKSAHLNMPTIETDDVLSTTIEFKAIPTDMDTGDEGYLGFSPKYTKTLINNLVTTGDGAGIAVTGVTVSPTTFSKAVNATQQLTATVSPANATNKGVTYTSSNTSVATISATGLVTGKAAGTATITVKTADGAKTATATATATITAT